MEQENVTNARAGGRSILVFYMEKLIVLIVMARADVETARAQDTFGYKKIYKGGFI